MSVDDPARMQEGERWGGISRRTLLKAGWTAPVILTVAPSVAFAASGSPGGSGNVNPTGSNSKNPQSGNQSPSGTQTTPSGTTGPTGAGSSGIPEQQSQGPQPARSNRGFTG
jgi:hypothetical protein